MSEAKALLKKLWAVPLLMAMATGAPAQTEADSQCENSALRRLAGENWSTSVWFSLGRYRALEDSCRPESNSGWYEGIRAELESFVGNHATALSYMDPDRDFASPVTSIPAAEYVIERARDHRIVMVNERHHVSTDRLLTMELLAPLAEQGFRYFAIEAVWSGDPVNARGYPIPQTGYYVNDVVFAEVVRLAIELGYQIIAYESEQGQETSTNIPASVTSSFGRRDWVQAKNIVNRVFDIDADAKLFVHAGYSHIRDSSTEEWPTMARFLRESTGFDLLAVDQTVYSERSRPKFEHPLRKRARELGLLGEEAVVLVDSEGQPSPPDDSVDLAVFGISTRYVDGRPTWMSMGGRRQAINFATPECAARVCIVEAIRAGFADEVPLDRVEITSAESTTLYLPAGKDIVVDVMGLDRSTLATRNLTVPEP